MKNYSEVPSTKKVTNNTGNGITLDLRDICNQVPVLLKDKDTVSVLINDSDALALLYKRCHNLGLDIEDVSNIKISFKASNETNTFKKGMTGTVKFDKMGIVNVQTDNDCTVNSLDGNFMIKQVDGVDNVFLNNNLDVGTYECKIQATDAENNKSNIETYNVNVIEDDDKFSVNLDIQYNYCKAGQLGTNGGDTIGTLTIINGQSDYEIDVKAPATRWYDNLWINSAYFRVQKSENENVYNIVIIHDLDGAALDETKQYYIFPLKFYVKDNTDTTVMVATEIRVLK